jgi:hypothetical protein
MTILRFYSVLDDIFADQATIPTAKHQFPQSAVTQTAL